MKQLISILCLAALVALLNFGCSPDWYRADADRQVNALVHSREKSALAYTPQVEVKPDSAPPAPKKAYAKIPTTPLPQPQPSPLEPLGRVPRGFMGPLPPEKSAGPPSSQPAEPDPLSVDLTDHVPVFGPPAPRGDLISIDLFGGLRYAVQHSRDYQSQMENLYLAALDVTLQRHLFEPRPFTKTGLLYQGGQRDVAYRSALNATVDAGVKQQLPYGGEVVAEALVGFIDALNHTTTDGESATVALSASIPLLRGAGLVNLEALISSERQLVYQVRAFENYRRTFAVDVARQYFSLLTRQQSINNRLANLKNLQFLVERTEALFEADRLNFLEVQRSQQAVLVARNDLLVAQQSYLNALDDFKVVLGMPVEQELDVVPVEMDVVTPELEKQDVVKLAETYRLDLQTARDQIEDAHRNIDVAKNGLLPDLNVTAGADFGNRLNTPAKSLDNRFSTYSAGVTLDLPLDRLAERNFYRRSLIGFERSQRGYLALHDQVASDVRSDVRGIQSAQVLVRIQQRGIRLAERRLEYANELLKNPTTSTTRSSTFTAVTARDVVDAQSSLLLAQDAYNQAMADLQVQVLQFLRDTGTLRVDPQSGTLGRALQRESNTPVLPAAGSVPPNVGSQQNVQ